MHTVYFIKLQDFDYKKHLDCLTEKRRSEILRLKDENLKAQKTAASYLLCAALKDNGINPDSLNIIKNQNGKPYFENKDDLFFNLSHCKLFAACALSGKCVGVDAETYREPLENLKHKLFTKDELSLLDAAPRSLQKQLLTRFWTIRESYTKYLGGNIIDIKNSRYTFTYLSDALAVKDNVYFHSHYIGDTVISSASEYDHMPKFIEILV